MLGCPTFAVGLQQLGQFRQPHLDLLGTLGVRNADRFLALQDAALDLQQGDFALDGLDLYRGGVLRERDPRAGGIQQTHRLVRQLARWNVAVRQLHRRFDGAVQNQHLVVGLHLLGDPAQHGNRLALGRLVDLNDLETPCQRRIFFNVLLVLGPGRRADGAQVAPRQRRLEQVGRIARALLATRPHQGVDLVDEQNDLARTGLHFVDHLAQALLELALHAGAGLQQTHVERVDRYVAQRRRHIARGNARGEAFHHGRLAHAGLTGQQRVVLAAAQQDVDDLANLVVAPGDRVELALLGLGGEVHRIFLERAALVALRTADGLAGLARLCIAARAGAAAAVGGGLQIFR